MNPEPGPSERIAAHCQSIMKALPITRRAGRWRDGLNLAGRMLWYVPGHFRFARWLGPRYSLRSVLFHDIADSETVFTRGLGISITRDNFESALRFLTRHYTPVGLQEVLDESDSHRLPPRPVLVTFDDVYASVREVAAPLCKKYGVPAVCFVNAAYLDNRQLALDNLICYATNVIGLRGINAAANKISAPERVGVKSMADVFSHFLPALSLTAREAYRNALIELLGIRDHELSSQAQMYLTSAQLRELVTFGFDIGNHTYTHVHCRTLGRKEFESEIGRNKMDLEALTGREVRSFSVPYGSSEDLSPELIMHLQHSGHEAAFLVESLSNQSRTDRFRLNRVSIRAKNDAGFFSEVEILPRFRSIRDRLSCRSSSQAL